MNPPQYIGCHVCESVTWISFPTRLTVTHNNLICLAERSKWHFCIFLSMAQSGTSDAQLSKGLFTLYVTSQFRSVTSRLRSVTSPFRHVTSQFRPVTSQFRPVTSHFRSATSRFRSVAVAERECLTWRNGSGPVFTWSIPIMWSAFLLLHYTAPHICLQKLIKKILELVRNCEQL